MLRKLFVQNLALIEDVRVELAEGFCAWTGETGAGKTLLLEALGLDLMVGTYLAEAGEPAGHLLPHRPEWEDQPKAQGQDDPERVRNPPSCRKSPQDKLDHPREQGEKGDSD